MSRAKAIFLAATITCVVAAPSVVQAQAAPTTAPPACAPADISGRGKPTAFPSTLSEKTLRSIGAATLLSLSGPEADWPRAEFKLPPLCQIGTLTAGSDVYVVQQHSGDAPLLWAQSQTRKTVAFLALAPDLPSAYKWYKEGGTGGMSPKSWTYFLTVMEDGDPELMVTRIYNGLPPLDDLKADIAASLQQKLRTIAVYHRDRQLVSVRLPSKVVEGDRFWR